MTLHESFKPTSTRNGADAPAVIKATGAAFLKKVKRQEPTNPKESKTDEEVIKVNKRHRRRRDDVVAHGMRHHHWQQRCHYRIAKRDDAIAGRIRYQDGNYAQ